MATIANLAVSVTARIGGFEKGIKRAVKIASRFASDLAGHIKTILKYGAAIVAVGAYAVTRWVKGQFEMIDAALKQARFLGLTTQQLLAYQYALDLAGGDQESFNKSITRMNRSIADAQSGSKKAAQEFGRVGIKVEELAGLSTDQRIKMIADRYNSIGDAAARASFLMTIFGRSGQAMGTLMEQGAKGIESAFEEFKKISPLFDDLDATKIEMANDAITKLKWVISGAARVLAFELSPYIIAGAEHMLKMSRDGDYMGEHVTNSFNNVLGAMGRTADYFELLKAGIFGFQWAVVSVARIVIEAFTFIPRTLHAMLNDIITLIQKFQGTKIGKVLSDALGIVPEDLYKFKTDFVEKLIDAYKETGAEAFDTAADALDKFNRKVHSSNAEVLFKQIKERADAMAKSIQASYKGTKDLAGLDTATRQGTGRIIDLRRETIGGAAGATEKGPTRKQSENMLHYLKVISQNTKMETAVVT